MGLLAVQIDHFVAKNMVISSSSMLGVLLLVNNEDFTKKAKVILAVETVPKKTHAGKLTYIICSLKKSHFYNYLFSNAEKAFRSSR